MKASIEDIVPDAAPGSSTPIPVVLGRESPDLVQAEIVTTGLGYQFKGSLGELSEKQTTSSSYEIEGVFYHE